MISERFFQLYQAYFQWDDDEFRFVLDQHAEVYFYSASSLNNSLRIEMSSHSDTLTWLWANQSLLFLIGSLTEEQHIPIL
jgi:hypothetical protein